MAGPTSGNGNGISYNNGENTLSGNAGNTYSYGSLLLTGGFLNNQKPTSIRVNDTYIDTVILRKSSGYDSLFPILLWKKLIAPTVVVEGGYGIRIYNYNPVQVTAVVTANGSTWETVSVPAAVDEDTPSYTDNIFIGANIYYSVAFTYSDNSKPYSPTSANVIGITEDYGFIPS